MSPAAAGILPTQGATVSILGQKVSWDALLVAGAGLVGVLFLYKVGQPTSTTTSPLSTVDPTGGGADAAALSTVPAAPPGPFDYSSAAGYAGPGVIAPGPGAGAGPTGPSAPSPAGPVTVPVPGASYQVPVASGSYIPSGAGGLDAGTTSGPAPAPSTAPSLGGPSTGYTQGSYTAPSPSSPPPPSTAPAPAGGGGGNFQP
jgi:hypothetical protein